MGNQPQSNLILRQSVIIRRGLAYFSEQAIVRYLIFVGALVFEFLAPPLDQILTTSGTLWKVFRDTY